MKKSLWLAVSILFVQVATAGYLLAEEAFPLRSKFPKVKTISTEALNREYGSAKIVDVRSTLEYDVIHINKALHIPVAQSTFAKEIEKVCTKNAAEPLVFYCNGHTCAKAYEAAEQAVAAGFGKVFAYDSGIHDWVRAYPEKTTLMGRTPAAKDKLIPHESLAKKKISYPEFKKKAAAANAVVIDIREPFQRKEMPALTQVRNIPSDRLIILLQNGDFKDKDMLVFDAVGKQVEWLQYYLEKYGYRNYAFLKNGVLSAKEAGGLK